MKRHMLGLTGVVFALALLLTSAAGAAPANQATVEATEDIYISRVEPGKNFDNGLLRLQRTVDSVNETDRVVLIKFNLSGVPFPIAKARLDLAAINAGSGCPLTSDSVSEIYVYGAGEGWNESSTWTAVGGLALRGAQKNDMDEASYVAPAHLHWTDESGLSTRLAAYLEGKRTTDPYTASLWIQLDGFGTQQVMFEDHERSGNSQSCPGADFAPTLQLSDAGQPLAVNTSSFSASASRPTWPLAALVAIIVAGGVVIYRKRAAGRA